MKSGMGCARPGRCRSLCEHRRCARGRDEGQPGARAAKGHPGTRVKAESCPGSATLQPRGLPRGFLRPPTAIQYLCGNPLLTGKTGEKYQLRLEEAGS